jgi:hypothetical protein
MRLADFCGTFQEESLLLQSCFNDMQQISRGKFDRLQRTTAGFTGTRLDGYGLCCSLPTRPRVLASNPILVHRHTPLLHASFRPRLATTPLRFANPSPPPDWIRDLHPQTVEHARHTMTAKQPPWKTLRVSHIPTARRRLLINKTMRQTLAYCWRPSLELH